MRKLNHLQRVLVVCIVIILIFGCTMMSLRQQAMSNMGYSGWTYIQYGLFKYPLKSVGNMFTDVSNLWHQYDDNRFLTQELAEQKSYKTLYEDERNKNDELEKLLDVKNRNEDNKTITCYVVNRSAESWDQTVTISAGKANGIKKNMLVQTSEGMVGLISKVETTTSTVQLLTSENMTNDIAVKMSLEDGTTVEGVITSYDTEKHAYKMALFDNSASVSSGQAVATSGKGGNYPSGIMVGTVTDVERSDDAIISTVYVKPVSNIQSFDYCIVIGSGETS